MFEMCPSIMEFVLYRKINRVKINENFSKIFKTKYREINQSI